MSFGAQQSERVKIANLTPQSRRVSLTAKIVSTNPLREVVSRRDGTSHKVGEFMIADETGSVLLTLWDADIEKVKDGDTVEIGNAYVTLFRGQMRLNIGKFGTLEISKTSMETVNTENNLSEKTYEQERSYGGYGQRRGGYGGGGGFGGGYGSGGGYGGYGRDRRGGGGRGGGFD
jgi:ssDNA-binding replication factor A large subunit